MFTQTRTGRLAALTAIALLSATGSARADEHSMPIFVEPPPAETLANILFPHRYRGVETLPKSEPDAFGMMINFDLNSAAIQPQSLPLLESIGEMFRLERLKNKAIVVEGHTDGRGTDAYNNDLSQRRAEAIKHYLVESFGISPSQLVTIGYGESDLYDAADPLDALNRRVVFRATQSISVE